MDTTAVVVDAGNAQLDGDLTVPDGAEGIVLFAHGSGSSRKSSRNVQVARVLQQAGIATLLFDLLTTAEDEIDVSTREYRFDIELLAGRLLGATRWVTRHDPTRGLPIGYFGASTGAAAALVAAAQGSPSIAAVVSRGGRPDLAGAALDHVTCPVQLIVGSADVEVLALNEQAAARIGDDVQLEIVAGATHLFEEPGALEKVSDLATAFFAQHLSVSD